MKTRIFALLAALCLILSATAYAEGGTSLTLVPVESAQPQEASPAEATPAPTLTLTPVQNGNAAQGQIKTTTEYRWFVNQYNNVRGRTVTYYDNVYAVNHGESYLTPFAATVPEEYFVVDENGDYAVAPIVLDIADAMRVRLYNADIGELGMLYGQYCERVRGKKGRVGFSGVHEGIDFVSKPGTQLYAILDGVVTRAGDSNGTVGVYSEEYDITLLYLHCEEISVHRGDVIEAGTPIGMEGKKGSGTAYAHVELRQGRHTSSSTYRDVILQSDCPYAAMQAALGVQASGREPVTYASILSEQRKLAEEEAARRAEEERIAAEQARQQAEAEAEAARLEAEREALEAAKTPEPAATPDVPLIDELPGTGGGYGFGSETPSGAAPTATPIPEATLPPAA